MSKPPVPSSSFMHWLGRQVGHIRRALQKDVTQQVVYRKQTVEEHPAPHDPALTLRRTTTDEVLRPAKPSE